MKGRAGGDVPSLSAPPSIVCSGCLRLYNYAGRAANFGDELNAWLFPRLFPGVFGGSGATLFLGIGSILFDNHPAHARKIVFGSGYGGYTKPPVLDGAWDVRFVRGPMTAARLGLPARLGVGDGAILLAGQGLVRRPVPARHIYIPHVDSACDGRGPKRRRRRGCATSIRAGRWMRCWGRSWPPNGW